MKEFLSWNPPKVREIISNGILLPQSRLVIHGKFKSWKSMLAMHTAFCISTGTPWFDFNVAQEEVLVIQVEVAEIAYHKRCKKYELYNCSGSDTSHLWVASEQFQKFDASWGMSELDRDIAKCGAKVIVIDPLYKIMSGDLNDGKDVMRLFDNLDILIDKHKCSIILVHHERKSSIDGRIGGSEEMTGSQYISNWADTVIGISRQSADWDDPVKLRLDFNAMRNAESFPAPLKIKISREDLVFKKDMEVLIPDELKQIIETALVEGEYTPLVLDGNTQVE
jgi:RecA-family ATPase